jgi:iron complex transport system substrate-binding protein
MSDLRIVTLIASATELVARLGYQAHLVGRSHECDFPPEVESLPSVSAPKFKADGGSYGIDQRVKAILQEGLGVYRVDADRLEALQPTHIVTQDHCQVCAVSFKDLEQAACQLISSRPKILSIHPGSLDGIWKGFVDVAEGLGDRSRGESLIAELRARMKAIEDRVSASFRNGAAAPVCVVHIEWMNPLMTGGNWMPELIRMAGGVTPFGSAGARSPKLSWDDVSSADPDALFICPCGFRMDRTMEEVSLLTGQPGWSELKAVRANRVFLADGNAYFNRPGPRVAESLEILAEILHPKLFAFGHEGTGWKRLSACASDEVAGLVER